MSNQNVFKESKWVSSRVKRNFLRKAPAVWLAPFLFLWIGCVHLIANFDPVTYKSLTDLKAETILFLQNIDETKPYAEYAAKFDDLKLQMEKIYEYEKGKNLNNDTIAQISEIRTMIQDLVTRYKGQNKLSPVYLEEKIKQLEQAFALTIATENFKSKGK